MGTSTSRDHTLGIHHHRMEEIEKPMEEEDYFHKTLIQKKQKLDPKTHKSTPTMVQVGLCDSKRPDHFQRGVIYFVMSNEALYVNKFLFYFCD